MILDKKIKHCNNNKISVELKPPKERKPNLFSVTFSLDLKCYLTFGLANATCSVLCQKVL